MNCCQSIVKSSLMSLYIQVTSIIMELRKQVLGVICSIERTAN